MGRTVVVVVLLLLLAVRGHARPFYSGGDVDRSCRPIEARRPCPGLLFTERRLDHKPLVALAV